VSVYTEGHIVHALPEGEPVSGVTSLGRTDSSGLKKNIRQFVLKGKYRPK